MRYLKNHFIKKLEIIAISVLLISCSQSSSLSNKSITNLNEIGVRIDIQQNPYNVSKNDINVFLFDIEDKQIGNKGIKIRVNNTDLSLHIKDELYYTKKMSYKGTNIPVSDSYYIDLKLSNDSIVPLAYIKSIPTVKETFITLDPENSINHETKIEWQNLNEFNKLLVWKRYKKHDSNTYGGGQYTESSIEKKIKENGIFITPTSYYRDSISTINNLYYEFHAIKKGLINPSLIVPSSITLKSQINKQTSIK